MSQVKNSTSFFKVEKASGLWKVFKIFKTGRKNYLVLLSLLWQVGTILRISDNYADWSYYCVFVTSCISTSLWCLCPLSVRPLPSFPVLLLASSPSPIVRFLLVKKVQQLFAHLRMVHILHFTVCSRTEDLHDGVDEKRAIGTLVKESSL